MSNINFELNRFNNEYLLLIVVGKYLIDISIQINDQYIVNVDNGEH